ncbi:MAG: hypothetical protein PHU56_02180 [Candidatus Pacebacteria bacterium]|nr:hypothetical protein [Candidatus Paceibacterota bacterium]
MNVSLENRVGENDPERARVEKNEAKETEAQIRKIFYETIEQEMEGLSKVNEIIYTLRAGNELTVNILPAKTLPLPEKLNLMDDGLRKIAQTVKNDSTIEKITAKSKLVSDHQKFMTERLGFAIDDAKKGTASMDRDTLIKKYSEK